jgi:hypothetical protein
MKQSHILTFVIVVILALVVYKYLNQSGTAVNGGADSLGYSKASRGSNYGLSK